jgi:hypothetical protein
MAKSDDEIPHPLELTYASPSSEVRWVTLGRFGPLEAQLLQARLQSEGIPCHLGNVNSASLNVPVMVEVDLQVLYDDLERARRILESIRAQRAARDGATAEQCPLCHKSNLEVIPFSIPFKMVSLFFLGLPFLLSPRFKRCKDCGHRWRIW